MDPLIFSEGLSFFSLYNAEKAEGGKFMKKTKLKKAIKTFSILDSIVGFILRGLIMIDRITDKE